MASNIKALIDEIFGFGTILNVPNVEPYDSYIWFRRDFDNFWPRCDNNIVENVTILDYYFDQIGWNGSIRIFKKVRNT